PRAPRLRSPARRRRPRGRRRPGRLRSRCAWCVLLTAPVGGAAQSVPGELYDAPDRRLFTPREEARGMSGRRSREKGARWEREVARRVRDVLGVEARRGIQYRDGSEAPDIIIEGLPLHIECKAGKRPPILAALEQAERDAAEGAIPVVVVKPDKKEPTVTMRLEDWLAVIAPWARRQP